MKTARSLFYLGSMGGRLYAVGGWTAPDTVTKRVEFYNPAENTWTYVKSLNIGLHEHAGWCAVRSSRRNFNVVKLVSKSKDVRCAHDCLVQRPCLAGLA